jgi:mono/diheme cytochrome c family protein
MFKALLVGIFLGVLLVAAGVWFYFTTGRAPVATTDPPMPFEKKLAHAALDSHLEKQAHPEPGVPAGEQSYLAGAQVYRQNCSVCHGLPGMAETFISQGMYPKPPQLFDGTGVTDDPAWETEWKAANGIRMTGMPGFKGRLTEAQLWQVSVLLANADKISPAVKAALTATPAPAPATSSSAPAAVPAPVRTGTLPAVQ